MEEVKVGVFLSDCGKQLSEILDFKALTEHVKKVSGVALVVKGNEFWRGEGLKTIVDAIKSKKINRLVVAESLPKLSEVRIVKAAEEAGLNPYLVEVIDLKDHCAWPHRDTPSEATEKAKDLVRSIVAKAKLLKPLKKPEISVTPVGLVIGDGVSGMTAALELARQGFEVHLVEREKELGGHLRTIHYLLEREENPKERLNALIKEVMENEKIRVHLDSEVAEVNGFVGNFKSKIKQHSGKEEEVEHGIVIVATGATEYKPKEYLYGKDPRVMTQHELEEKLVNGKFKARNVVMIQCVGARNEERPNCSRICCGQAIKNALRIKELSPETEIYVLFKDIRSYGFKEDYYREAAQKGVLFINYEDERKPQVTNTGEKLKVSFWEPVLKETVEIEPDFLILSAATIPNPDNKRIAEMLKVPLTKDGFFLEAHMKLRPVDFATEGVFLCGMAHSPKYIDESIAQACAAAARATTILSKPTLEMEGIVANVNEDLCSGCRICEYLCPYGAIEMKEKDGKLTAHVIEALCKGCGACGTACPTKAIIMGHFTTEEILAQVKAALVEVQA